MMWQMKKTGHLVPHRVGRADVVRNRPDVIHLETRVRDEDVRRCSETSEYITKEMGYAYTPIIVMIYYNPFFRYHSLKYNDIIL